MTEANPSSRGERLFRSWMKAELVAAVIIGAVALVVWLLV